MRGFCGSGSAGCGNGSGRNVRRVITFGTFDLLHEGHLNILRRARAEGDHLVVGVSSDRLNDLKGKRCLLPAAQRMACVAALRWVDEVFLEESLEQKDDYVRQYRADLLVMGDDWQGKFDWVSCPVRYLPRTEGISTTQIKTDIRAEHRCDRALFGDTYLKKHMDCAVALVNQLTRRNVAPILTDGAELPRAIEAEALVYFNLPLRPAPPEYADAPRVLIDHGASHLKWFLGNARRFAFFDAILTAGPDHVRALQALFGDHPDMAKVRAVGFIKSDSLLAPPSLTRAQLCAEAGLDPGRPIVLFAPTWHIAANRAMVAAIAQMAQVNNHVATLHPETRNLSTTGLNLLANQNGITTELIKHADLVVSDLSSTLYEAAALGKPTVQLLLEEYPDNPAVLFDFPYTAGSAELFCSGPTCRPEGLGAMIAQVLDGDAQMQALTQACHQRILAGTLISDRAADALADEIARACAGPRGTGAQAAEPLAARGPALRNLDFAGQRMIAHAGGNFDGLHATNSLEALTAALPVTRLVELDFCLGRDGVLVAHDGFEGHYGLATGFADIEVQAFSASRFKGCLTPLTVAGAMEAVARAGGTVVCDIKPVDGAYHRIAEAIHASALAAGMLDGVVLQCYCPEDFAAALRLGFRRILLPVWKYHFRDPLGAGAMEFLTRCLEINADAVQGLSIPYQNPLMNGPSVDDPRFGALFGLWKRIFIHGAPPEHYGALLDRNLGLFADVISRDIEFRDVPAGFDWRQYLFLNPDLARDGLVSQVAATAHFLRHGRAEGRRSAYDLPKGFSYESYMDRNPGLLRKGVCGPHSAAAHATRHGVQPEAEA